jgi:hypothetical protein
MNAVAAHDIFLGRLASPLCRAAAPGKRLSALLLEFSPDKLEPIVQVACASTQTNKASKQTEKRVSQTRTLSSTSSSSSSRFHLHQSQLERTRTCCTMSPLVMSRLVEVVLLVVGLVRLGRLPSLAAREAFFVGRWFSAILRAEGFPGSDAAEDSRARRPQ